MYVDDTNMYTRFLKTVNSHINLKMLQQIKIKFKKCYSTQVILELFRRDHYDVCKNMTWLKTNGFFDWSLWKPIFQIMQVAPVGNLYLTNFRNPRIIRDIVDVQFPKMKLLALQDNLICTIEVIQKINMPGLRRIKLNRNLLRSIRCLKKCIFPQLRQINISDNLILECHVIARISTAKFNNIVLEQKTLNNIYMIYRQGQGQVQLPCKSDIMGDDIKWVLKLQSKELKQLRMAADKRLIKKKIEQEIAKKYYKIQVQKRGMVMGANLPLMAH